MIPTVDLVVLTRDSGPLDPAVEQGIHCQRGVQIIVHRVVGQPRPEDECRREVIARARNEAKFRGNAEWLMFLDDDVVLDRRCIATLVEDLRRRPVYAALAADYLGEYRAGQIAHHVSMGATLFRRDVLEQLRFTWSETKCECQCCCDDLRKLHWGIDYSLAAKARHLAKDETSKSSPAGAAVGCPHGNVSVKVPDQPAPAWVPSVCLVLCYFGPPPGWIKPYLLGCAYNPSIDFLIFTDQEDFPVVPPNVRVKRLSSSSFNTHATKTIGVETKLSHPRKLSDFKPTYGHLFEEFLDGWDYWGYADLDVIYGDIRRFLTAARLPDYDIYTARKEFLVGHFTLLRNNRRMKTLYRQSADFQATLQSPHVLSFDECGKQWGQRLQGRPLSDDATCDSMTHVVHRKMAEHRVSACFSSAVVEWPDLATPTWRLRWDGGRLWIIDQHREAMYFHFHAFKRLRGYRQPCCIEGDTVFEMSPKGIERVPVPIELAWN